MLIYLRLEKKNEIYMGDLEVASIEDKMRKTCLRWLDFVRRRPIDAMCRKIDFLKVTGTSRGRHLRKLG